MVDLLDEEEIDSMRAIADRMRASNGSVVYGFFPGGDPREFCPDPECCTAEQLEAHEQACKLAEQGVGLSVDGGCELMTGRRPPFGIGTYEVKDEAIEKLARELDDWLDAVRNTEGAYL